ncbi:MULTISPECIES: type II toxin-antitoxin system HicA family toxin [Nostocales]|uniref:Type II toxin-antitoxin system HicA family toxin n=2 Tax=Aphanizomenonaceae TaxID=1892259 RepID=A0ABY5LXY4_9CYAN|nr:MULTISPECIES: type II toxin-antitoxin system HicA family toxin [Nostocales]MBO1072448.1 addiction module toxin, HicA family [Dolichospermum sp. DEX189]MCX5982944.1 type II toxin-antitoxin system HicA family toxin [Nostocales cyanobacterium LacPavin_0920_SED1_MAG_38_18]MDK2409451.1 type II toxin-antitoxin system HicA family toxin [Aphanizomenon sp. 202]MDK2460555.1 type II toxin-antitoxin system HicA family toxin [Aphanizomenon sp. PH219]QSV74035.1 MAG: addiction module toxin, HicA family [A
MPKLPRLTAKESEKLLLNAGFIEMRSKGSHRIYFRENVRVVIPFHSGKILHPKTVQQVFTAIEAFAVENTEEEINKDD